MDDINDHDIVYIKDGFTKDVVSHVMIPSNHNYIGTEHSSGNEIIYLENYHSMKVYYLRHELLSENEYKKLIRDGKINELLK